jgi:plasmid stability protein
MMRSIVVPPELSAFGGVRQLHAFAFFPQPLPKAQHGNRPENRQSGGELDTRVVQHKCRAMRNVTIKLDDDLARWARIRAAEEDKSLSRLIADMLREARRSDERYRDAAAEFASVSPAPLKEKGGYPSRESLHER